MDADSPAALSTTGIRCQSRAARFGTPITANQTASAAKYASPNAASESGPSLPQRLASTASQSTRVPAAQRGYPSRRPPPGVPIRKSRSLMSTPATQSATSGSRAEPADLGDDLSVAIELDIELCHAST